MTHNREDAYQKAGVDIDLESTVVSALISRLTYRRCGSFPMAGKTGHFAGLISFGEYYLGLVTDGVGTKMLIADLLGDWRTVGIDCVAMNVNDLYVMNLEPIAFVDYIASPSFDLNTMKQIGDGLNEGARLANMNIVGGETATLKGLVSGLDLAGACLGVQKQDAIVTGEKIRPGDLVIGIPSSGIHSNGLTLARKIVEDHASFSRQMPSGKTFGEELLTPTRIYHEIPALCNECRIHGMCHITGGGLLNFLRLSPFGIEITSPLHPQEIFSWMQKAASVPVNDMYRTFNMGMGFAVIVDPSDATRVCTLVPDARVVGKVIPDPTIRFLGEEIT